MDWDGNGRAMISLKNIDGVGVEGGLGMGGQMHTDWKIQLWTNL